MMFRVATLLSTLCLLLVIPSERMYSMAFSTVGRDPTQQRRTCILMNSNQLPISPTSGRSVFVKNSVFGISSLLSAALLKREKAVAIDLPECSDSVTIFRRAADKREIIMIGTAHISEESANLVRRTIKTVKPDVVMIELDPKRIGRVSGSNQTLEQAGFDLPVGSEVLLTESVPVSVPLKEKNFVTKWIDSFSNTVSVWVQSAGGALLGRVLSEFYKSVEKLGFVAGGEFKAAVEEGRAIGSRILLGDRDVDITLSRLATAVSDYTPENFDRVVEKISKIEEAAGIKLPNSEDAEISKDAINSFMESVKQKDLLVNVLGVVKEELPEVYAALIGERDAFMAEAVGSSPGSSLVGVVGMAHMGGIEKYLVQNKGFSVVNRNCPATK